MNTDFAQHDTTEFESYVGRPISNHAIDCDRLWLIDSLWCYWSKNGVEFKKNPE